MIANYFTLFVQLLLCVCICLSVQKGTFFSVAWLGQLFTIEVFPGNIISF